MAAEGRSPAAVLSSGGLDSAVLLAETAREAAPVHPVYVRCGLAWEAAELESLRAFLRAWKGPARDPVVLDLPMGDVYGRAWYASGEGIPGYHRPDEEWEIPGRNIVLLVKAAVWCRLNGVGRIAIGTLASNPFPDATPRFVAAMEEALSAGLGAPLAIRRPFAGLRKAEVIRLGRDLPLELTLSCASPAGGIHCGTCGKCRERIEAFREAGVADPTAYAAPAPAR